MTFADLPGGALFRFDWSGLPPQMLRWNGSGPFRKVGERFALVTDERAALMVGPPKARVLRVRERRERT